MATIDQAQVMAALGTVMDPDLHKDLVTLGMVRDVEISGTEVSLRVVLTTPACPLKERIQGDVEAALERVGVTKVNVTMDAEVQRASGPATAPGQPQRMPGVKAVIAVISGKGGVGKSTVAVNLAVSLQRLGARVGLLDADIYGPSLPIMMGLQNSRPAMTADERIAPLLRYGISVMSMGFMLKEDQAVVWRGPMLGKALQQFIEDVDWGNLDYVVVDMPPGTGDVQLSLGQLLPVTGAVVVTTPQDVAFADVRRAIKMLELTKIPSLGLVENMSGFVCGSCGASHAIFGESRIESHAARLDMEVLAKLPLDSVTAVAADQGEPIVVASPGSHISEAYKALAQNVARAVALQTHAQAASKSKLAGFFQRGPG